MTRQKLITSDLDVKSIVFQIPKVPVYKYRLPSSFVEPTLVTNGEIINSRNNCERLPGQIAVKFIETKEGRMVLAGSQPLSRPTRRSTRVQRFVLPAAHRLSFRRCFLEAVGSDTR
jgi:hypothetical protein